MQSSPPLESAFVRCRLWTPISVDWFSPMRSRFVAAAARWAQGLGGKSIVFRALFFGGMILLFASGIYTVLVLTAVHESPLRAIESVGPSQSGDEYVARAADCVACHSI